jgi:hypothetical protein
MTGICLVIVLMARLLFFSSGNSFLSKPRATCRENWEKGESLAGAAPALGTSL